MYYYYFFKGNLHHVLKPNRINLKKKKKKVHDRLAATSWSLTTCQLANRKKDRQNVHKRKRHYQDLLSRRLDRNYNSCIQRLLHCSWDMNSAIRKIHSDFINK